MRTEEAVLPSGVRVRMTQLGARAAGDLMRRLVQASTEGNVALSVGALSEEDFTRLFDLALGSSEVARTPKDSAGVELVQARTWTALREADLYGFPDTMKLLDLCLRINVLDFLGEQGR